MAEAFIQPDFLQGTTAEEIQQRMMNNLPEDIDGTPGGFAYDFTMPTALEKSELLNFHLIRAIMIMFPQWAWGDWLDKHAQSVGLTRRAATQASGTLTVTGISGTVIPAGFLFAVPAVNDSPAIEFAVQEETVIGASGSADISVAAVESGKSGNVPAGSVVIMTQPVTGITTITNPEAISGGTEEEDDETLRERILETLRNIGNSFVGCDADYIRWAKEVDGVGTVLIDTQYETAHPNYVRLTVLDRNGFPANDAILRNVYRHIMGVDRDSGEGDRTEERLAPIGAVLFVEPPGGTEIAYSITNLSLKEGFDTEAVLRAFGENLRNYYPAAKEAGVVRYTQVCSILSRTNGVIDFSALTMNGQTENITIGAGEYPYTKSLSTDGETEVQLFSVGGE